MTTKPATVAHAPASLGRTARKVVIVNGSPTLLSLLEGALDVGRYDVVFVESTANAYSQIRRIDPDLVILCVHIEESEGFQLLSMLKLDEVTRSVPVVTFATELDGKGDDEEAPEPAVGTAFTMRPAQTMN